MLISQSEDGDIIDCVDVYKQPAFNHLLLANHTLQSDNYGATGCYNLDCPGFVQTSYKFSLGTSLTLYISKYGGDQFETSFNIHKDMKSGNWWLRIQDEDIGYWPVEIFKNGGLSRSSTKINYGGEITNTKQQGLHTKTNMGSGHFAEEGWSKAALVRNIEYIDDAGARKDAADQDITVGAVRPECYSVVVEDWEDFDGTHFYYGGPGYSDSCKN
ncbi:hypothetical protein LINGRAHAP2_LOCUS9009 [Linum grandiflorum]